ncbi:hypothetical protein ACWIUD_07520 [Helicobacter sp. 23-1044]
MLFSRECNERRISKNLVIASPCDSKAKQSTIRFCDSQNLIKICQNSQNLHYFSQI